MRGEKKRDRSQAGAVLSPVLGVWEGFLKEATTNVRTDLWKKLVGKGVPRLERTLPIDSEWPDRRERMSSKGHGGGGVMGDAWRFRQQVVGSSDILHPVLGLHRLGPALPVSGCLSIPRRLTFILLGTFVGRVAMWPLAGPCPDAEQNGWSSERPRRPAAIRPQCGCGSGRRKSMDSSDT